jgi:glycosyltransferase involved in cell wall biosynthesis
MKVVYISNKPIFPLIDGGCIAMHQFLKSLLLAGYYVKNFTISTHKHPFSIESYPKELADIIRPHAFKVDTRIKPLFALKYLFKKGSYNIDRFTNQSFKEYLKKYLNENKVDLVIFESIYLSGYISTIRNNSTSKIIVRSHNVEYLIWERLAINQTSLLKKLYFQKLARDLKKNELINLNKIDGLVCITDQDQKVFIDNNIQIPKTTIPVAIEKTNLLSDYSINTFFYLGAMNWQPNIESVEWLLNSIFPKIRQIIPDAKILIAGSFMPDKFKSDESKGIEIIGFVKKTSDFIANNGIMLAPIKSGSGVRIKLLESMNLGVAIVTTNIGSEGINGLNGYDFFSVDNEEEFINVAVELAKNKNKRELIGRNAKALIENNYQLEYITKNIIEFIKKIQ